MVGRAGRSKGCSNCRRRRVKCDETHPICDRCKKLNLRCDGPRGSTWINHHPSVPPPDQSAFSIPGEISFIAFEDDICVAYTRKHLMRGGCVEIACDLVQRYGTSGGMPEPGLGLLRNAILSLSATFYGNQHRQKTITNRGYSMYGNVLGQLNGHLTQPHLQTTDETILTAITCMILEIFIPTGSNNFFKHVQGVEAILAARGPPTSPQGTHPAMLSGIRILCIVGALIQRRPSVWASEGWRSFRPLLADEDSQIRHEILLILADCTTIKERDRRPSLGNLADEEEPHSIALMLSKQLDALHLRWRRHNDSMLGGEQSLAKDPTIANHASATTYMLYNAAVICVLQNLNAHNQPHISSPRSQQVVASLRIVKCLELKACEKREGGGESNTIGFVATKVAWETLGGFSSPGGRRLSRAVKAAANGVFAVGAWDEPQELS